MSNNYNKDDINYGDFDIVIINEAGGVKYTSLFKRGETYAMYLDAQAHAASLREETEDEYLDRITSGLKKEDLN